MHDSNKTAGIVRLTYITMGHVCATTGVVEKQEVLHIVSVGL